MVRQPTDRGRIERLMEAFARVASGNLRVYFVRGTTAVLMGWRDSTIDVDFVMRPEDDAILPAIDPASFRRAVEAVFASE